MEILRDLQLGIGVSTDGSPIRFQSGGTRGAGHYSALTQEYADEELEKTGGASPRNSNKRGRYNMEWSGELFDSMVLRTQGDTFEIFSRTGKDEFLKSRGYNEFMGLTKENNDYVNEMILMPLIMGYVLDNLLNLDSKIPVDFNS